MSVYTRNSPRRRRNRTAEILTLSLLVGLVVLLGVGGLFWLAQNGLLSGPTPTPTATAAPASTLTPDFRATRVMEDMLTQVAYSATIVGREQPSLPGTLVADAPTDIQIFAPITQNALVTQNESGATPTPVALSPLADVPLTAAPPITQSVGSTLHLATIANGSPLPTPTPTFADSVPLPLPAT
ncbi:MAG: hypothetical protein M3Q45_05685, partial [Chloroflexota bacterium]|nr:hypothetical protein [Chloroflexota bacterium]